MSAATPSNQDRSVSVGGSITGSVVQTGDSNIASIQFQQAALSQPETVNIQAKLNALRELLLKLG